jgi:hypothetical protein
MVELVMSNFPPLFSLAIRDKLRQYHICQQATLLKYFVRIEVTN